MSDVIEEKKVAESHDAEEPDVEKCGAKDKKDANAGASPDPVEANYDYTAVNADAELAEALEDRASCFSKWFLLYLTPLLKLGATKGMYGIV